MVNVKKKKKKESLEARTEKAIGFVNGNWGKDNKGWQGHGSPGIFWMRHWKRVLEFFSVVKVKPHPFGEELDGEISRRARKSVKKLGCGMETEAEEIGSCKGWS